MTDPSLCPTPQYHASHHYCPSCTFTSGTAPEGPATKAARLEAERDVLLAALRDAHAEKDYAVRCTVDSHEGDLGRWTKVREHIEAERDAARRELADLRAELEACRTWQAKRLVAISQDPMCVKWMREAEQAIEDAERAEAETAELRARIQAVCDEHQCDETCELIDCEHPAGYWVSIERVRAALFPAEEAPSE